MKFTLEEWEMIRDNFAYGFRDPEDFPIYDKLAKKIETYISRLKAGK